MNVYVTIFSKINKRCCTIIRQVRAPFKSSFYYYLLFELSLSKVAEPPFANSPSQLICNFLANKEKFTKSQVSSNSLTHFFISCKTSFSPIRSMTEKEMKIMSKQYWSKLKSLKGLFTFFKTQLCLCGLGRAGMRARLISWQAQSSAVKYILKSYSCRVAEIDF